MKIPKKRLHKVVKEMVDKEFTLEYSRPQIAEYIENFGVLIDGVVSKKRLDWVLEGQIITLNDWPKINHGDFDKVKLLWENENLMTLFKPVGIVVQSGASHGDKNLVNWLRENYKSQKFFDLKNNPTGGLINRLDKDTQGLILVAKSLDDKQFFQDQFRQRSVVKTYITLLEGNLSQQIVIKNWQSRMKANPTKQILFWDEKSALRYDKNARFAESVFKPLYFCKNLNQTICEVSIKTGRMHQIRLQAEYIGFPLLNDTKYNKRLGLNNLDQLVDFSDCNINELDEENFLEQKNYFFEDSDFCLLSNYLKIQLLNGLEFEYTYKKY